MFGRESKASGGRRRVQRSDNVTSLRQALQEKESWRKKQRRDNREEVVFRINPRYDVNEMPDATHNDALPTAPFHSRSSLSDNPDFAQIHKFKRTEQALKWQAGVFLDANNDYGYIGALVALRAQECARLKLEAEAYDPFERDPAVIQRRWKAIAAKEKEKDHIMSVFDEMDKPIECE
ncbi:hypothetical protein PRIPAC_95165 [Pristionchus pacificus]|uniref:Uncharacterized protein n=1 Tax=Pristionchus pacificus TaxID=54126 RepID=A0A2A6BIT8_PRIPA|nr:hypothetical protein PRIPAC_95165 [Pristionchus pacificus]|eukprot:PDM65797.1 hypothetical protein PRIPAC_45198 [Pristionchus pacificus]